MRNVEENKSTVRRYIEEIINDLDFTHVEEIIHEDFYGKDGNFKNKEDHKKRLEAVRKKIPDLIINLVEMSDEEDKVIARSIFTGTETKRSFFRPAMGKQFQHTMVERYTLKNGKVAKIEDARLVWDSGIITEIERMIKEHKQWV